MLAHKHITKIAAVLMALAAALCLAASAFAGQIAAAAGDTGVTIAYETALFNTDSIISVNILMDQEDWEDMLANAASEEYYPCDVEINGETFYRVGIRPKGNTSLSAIVSDPDTDRYSFKLEFDRYVDGQTCWGLDKLVLNNNYADATNMKEALVYDMYQYLGADASLYNYAQISVNGEYWGVYLALEAVEDSFLLRNYGAESGELYKPEGVGGGAGDKDGMGDLPDMDNMPDMSDLPDMGDMPEPQGGNSAADSPDSSDTADTNTAGSNGRPQQPDGADRDGMPTPPEGGDMPDGTDGGMGGSSGGADLNYTDDELDSYDTIWDGEVTSTSKSDHKRVVTALRNIAEGTELETYMDVDNLLKYMAVHAFAVNEDSLSGSMAHNYYLYESGGRLNLIPWDYNLAFGGMGGGDASSVINDPIADPFSGTDFFDTLLANETYRARYYAYLRQLAEEYVDGGGLEAFYTRVRSQIDGLVESDPTAFYTYDEYVAAAETLYQVVQLRARSVKGQVDGIIPDTAAGQQGSDALVDDAGIDLSVMGTMSAGGTMGGGGGRPGDMGGGFGGMPNGGPPDRSDTAAQGDTAA